MKKLFSLLLILLAMFMFVACDDSNDPPATTTDDIENDVKEEVPADQQVALEGEDKTFFETYAFDIINAFGNCSLDYSNMPDDYIPTEGQILDVVYYGSESTIKVGEAKITKFTIMGEDNYSSAYLCSIKNEDISRDVYSLSETSYQKLIINGGTVAITETSDLDKSIYSNIKVKYQGKEFTISYIEQWNYTDTGYNRSISSVKVMLEDGKYYNVEEMTALFNNATIAY